MNTATIQITPRAFGNIAAAAMSHGCDVTSYLVRTAIAHAGTARRESAMQTSTPAADFTTAAPVETAPEPAAPVQAEPAGSSGMFADL